MVNGFDSISGIGREATQSIFGSQYIAGLLLVVFLVAILVWLGVYLEITIAVAGIFVIGLALVGWLPEPMSKGIVITIVAVITGILFLRFNNG